MNTQILAIMFYNFQRDLFCQQCQEEMVRVLREGAPFLRTVKRCYKQFVRSDFNLETTHVQVLQMM